MQLHSGAVRPGTINAAVVDVVISFSPNSSSRTKLAEVVRDTKMSDLKKKRQGQHSDRSQQVLKRPRSCTETSGSALCLRHNRPLDVYCCTDEKIICAQCTSAEHIGHRIGWVKEERRRKQEELKNMQTNFKKILEKQKRKWKTMKEMHEQIQEEARQAEAFCESVIVSVIDSLQKHYLSVKELIAAQEEAAAAQVCSSLQSLEMEMEETRKRDAELDHLAQTESNVHFLQTWPPLKLLCEKTHLHPSCEVSGDPLLPFKLTKRAVENLGKQLEEFCEREFTSVCHNDVSEEQQESAEDTDEDDEIQQRCETIISQPSGLFGVSRPLDKQRVEPTTRQEFLEYACELSLDPTTAHEDLAISEGEKEVMLCSQRCKNPGFRHPERFIHRRQVLCREGLQGKRCYYEVEVKGDKAEIALAYKGIDRKSRTERSAFGGNANSWSLDRSKNYSVSHKADSVQLTTPPSHHRIGVYLKFQEGILSFYEVSDRMEFLYKVETEFTEPLYPGFWLGEKCCIRICDLRQQRL